MKNLSDKEEGLAKKPTIQSHGCIQVTTEVFIFAIRSGVNFPSSQTLWSGKTLGWLNVGQGMHKAVMKIIRACSSYKSI